MYPINKLKNFPFKTQQIRIPNVSSQDTYSIIFYPENTTFLQSYNTLGIKKQDSKSVYVLGNKRPRLIINASLMKKYRELGLIALPRNLNNIHHNFFIDCTPYLLSLEHQYNPKSYKPSIINSNVKMYIDNVTKLTPQNKKIFLYCIDMKKELNPVIFQRRIFPIAEMIKNEEILPYDYFLLCLINGNKTIYTLLSNPEESILSNRAYLLLKNIQSKVDEIDQHQEADNASTSILNDIDDTPDDPSISKVKTIVGDKTVPISNLLSSINTNNKIEQTSLRNYLKSRPTIRDFILKNKISDDEKKSILAKALLYQSSGKLEASEKIVDKISNKDILLNQIRKNLISDIIPKESFDNSSREIINKNVNINLLNEYHEPSHLLQKRESDFHNSFRKDLQSSFNLLSNKSDFPLKLDSIVEEEVPVDPSNLDPTYEMLYKITLLDERKRKHKVEIKIPKLMKDRTFIINGKKKFLMYQIILDPIFFLKKYLVKLETLYATVSIESKQLKTKNFLKMRIAGPWLPLILVMSFYLGFKEGLKLFNIKYRVQDEKPQNDEYYLELKDGYIICDIPNEHAKQYLNSFKECKYKEFTKENIFEKNTINEAIIKETENRNTIYIMGEVLKNIMEPISVQILKSKMLPTTFEQCVLYMSKGVVTGKVDARNDIGKQRLRSSEVFNHQILKQLLKSYNTYKLQRISGDTKSEYTCNTERVIKEIINSKLVRNLENVNPLEELSCLTRTTPIGFGGVPDSRSINKSARGTHTSYYGNLDPMDTPEGDTIGVINQLAVSAAITNSRGSFIIDDKEKKAGQLGTSTVFTPFVNFNSGNRIQFGCSQSRQAVAIVGNEPPLCQTGFETTLTPLLSDCYIRKSPVKGTIIKISDNIVVVKGVNNRLYKVPLTPSKLNSAQGQDAISILKPNVKIGQKVKENQIVAEGKHIINGTISTGLNLLTAIMGWKGYQFEDGYVISDSLLKKKLVSKHYFERTIVVNRDDNVRYIAQEGQDTLRGEPLLIKTSSSLEELVGLDEDEIVGGEQRIKSPGGRILSIEIYPNMSIKKFPVLHESFIQFKKKYEEVNGEFPKKFTKKVGQKEISSGIIITFKLEDDFKVSLGDKLANRHGNKGVITYIEKEENMPMTPWGEPIEIIYNPLAIINRMNPGQLYELYISLIAKFAAKQLVSWGTKKTVKAVNYIINIYKGLDGSKGKKYSQSITKLFQNMSSLQYSHFIQDIYKRDYFLPIIIPQFNNPSREQIKNVLKFLNLKDSYYLTLPEYNKKTLFKVAVGYMYFNKLEMQAIIKMSARSTGGYSSKTLQPLAGKKVEGGQRAGEADIQMFLSHGAINIVKEFLGPLSDDQLTKNQIISEIIQTGYADYREPRTSPTRNLLSIYMTSLGLEV